MSSLKQLRSRIDSVKSTRKITAAMKAVAGAKLRRAQTQAENARHYARRLEDILQRLAPDNLAGENPHALLQETARDQVYTLIVVAADRGLCGNYNTTVIRAARQAIRHWQQENKQVKIIAVGRKVGQLLGRQYTKLIVKEYHEISKPVLSFAQATMVADYAKDLFEKGESDRTFVLYNEFKSAISQQICLHQLIPLALPDTAGETTAVTTAGGAIYTYEPSEREILETLLPRNLTVQVYKALLESAASEHGSRMTAMDNATRNAGDMIKRLTLQYNRTRQAIITKELIEIISGAEAL